MLVPAAVWWLVYFCPRDCLYRAWEMAPVKALAAAGEATHKVRTICAACAKANEKWIGNWAASLIVGCVSGSGGTIIAEGVLSRTSAEACPGWGQAASLSIAATYTLLARLLEPHKAIAICHALSVVHWVSKAVGTPLNAFAWLQRTFRTFAPYDRLNG